MKTRIVAPELLETLAVDDPAAIKSRRDLRWVNGIMGNHRWILSRLKRLAQPGDRVLELGAGDGSLGRRLVQEQVCPAENLHGIDLIPRPDFWPEGALWTQGDVLDPRSPSLPEAEVVIVNLFLHHLTDPQLTALGARLPASCRVLLAAEPSRRRMNCWMGAFFCTVARLHPVTRHDMMVSIRGGFLPGEMETAMDLRPPLWLTRVSMSLFGSCRLIARKQLPAATPPPQ